MDERLRKRIFMFYLGGVINVFLGLYVFIEGASFLDKESATWIVVFFLTFAAIDFYFPYAMKKKWHEDQAARLRAQGGASAGPGGGRT